VEVQEVIFSHSGIQFNAKVGDILSLRGHLGDAGETLEVGSVLALKTEGGVKFGVPYVEGAKVGLGVIGCTKGPKVRVFKMIRRKRHRRTLGYRDLRTLVKVQASSA
jgi:large subunit ribosomal protein L21